MTTLIDKLSLNSTQSQLKLLCLALFNSSLFFYRATSQSVSLVRKSTPNVLLVRNKFLWVGIDIRFTPLSGFDCRTLAQNRNPYWICDLIQERKAKGLSGRSPIWTHVRPDKRPSRQTSIQTNLHLDKHPSGHTYIHWIFVFRSIWRKIHPLNQCCLYSII